MTLPAWSEQFARERLGQVPATLPPVVSRRWAFEGATGAGVRVAVVDSGIDASHPAVGAISGGVIVEYDADAPPSYARITEVEHGDVFGHGAAIVGFCELCQLVLCGGTPARNSAVIAEHDGRRRIFCSEPCRWIFESEPERYAGHAGLVQRVLEGKAPANILALLRQTFRLTYDSWGKDAFGGDYPWLAREPR